MAMPARMRYERHECAAFVPANVGNTSVHSPSEPLVHDRHGIVSGLSQRDGDLDGKVLVDLNFIRRSRGGR